MFGLRQAFVFSTLLLSTVASPTHHHDDELTNWEKFSALLDTVDEVALHHVLHALSPKFKDGIFSKDRSAIEHVHSENPIMASKLVHIAKRQGSNSTITTSASTSAAPSTTDTSAQASISSALSSALSSELTATTVPPPTTVIVAPTTPSSATAVSTESGAVVYSTFGGGVTTLTSSAISVEFTPSTSTRLYTSTADNGSIQTSTAVVVVNAPVTRTAAATGAAGAATTSGSGGLQSGGEKIVCGGLVAFLAAAVGLVAHL